MIRAACHIHSEWSYDGKWTLPALARQFEGEYRVLMITDHDRGFSESRRLEHREACAQASSEKILLVPGIEYSDAQNLVHILVWGPVRFLGEGLPTLELLKGVQAANGVAVMAHPARRQAWKTFDPVWAEYLLGMEVWNRKTDGWAPSPVAQRLMEGTSLLPFVCLDFHAINQMFPLSVVMDIASGINEESVLDCLRRRACRPLFFSEPAEDVINGWPRFALKPVERARRSAAQMYRWLKKRGRGA
jgi:hypothetical protein